MWQNMQQYYNSLPAAPPPPDPTWYENLMAYLRLLWVSVNKLGISDPTNIRLAALLLCVVLICWAVACWRYFRVRSRYGVPELVNVTSARVGMKGELFRLILRMLAPVAVGVALLNPFLPGVPHYVPSGKRDYAICVADNRGMGAVDTAPVQADPRAPPKAGGDGGNETKVGDKSSASGSQFFHESGSRMDFVRQTIRELLKTVLVKTPVSLIAFQGGANILVPLTDSPEWFNDTLDPSNKFGLRVVLSSPIGSGNVDGKVSTIAACLQTARQVFDSDGVKGHDKFVVYFGNGDDISADDWMADEVAKVKEQKIDGVIFGVGGPPIQIPVYKGDDEQFAGYYKFRDGSEALSGLNEENLTKLSQATGWQYIHLDPKQKPTADFLVQHLTDSKLEVGKFPVFDFPVAVALGTIFLVGIGDLVSRFVSFLGRIFTRRRRQ